MGCSSSFTVDSAIRSEEAFLEEYHLSKKLGEGGYGQVRLASDRKYNTYAVKVLQCVETAGAPPLKKFQKAFHQESSLLRQVSGHKNIVRFHQAFGVSGTHYIVMEACKCSVLVGLIDRHLSPRDFPRYFREMALGLAHCHAAGVIHRDVKPDNFLLGGASGEEIKLTDFGSAAMLPQTKRGVLYDVVGTAPYMSPELLAGKGHNDRTDVWSLGVTAYVMLFGAYPYQPDEKSRDAMRAAIIKDYPRPSFTPTLPATSGAHGIEQSLDAIKFVKTLLTRDMRFSVCEKSRISMHEVLELSFVAPTRPPAASREMVGALKNAAGTNDSLPSLFASTHSGASSALFYGGSDSDSSARFD